MNNLLARIKKEKLYMTVVYNPDGDSFTCDLTGGDYGCQHGWGIGTTMESAIVDAIQNMRR